MQDFANAGYPFAWNTWHHGFYFPARLSIYYKAGWNMLGATPMSVLFVPLAIQFSLPYSYATHMMYVAARLQVLYTTYFCK